MMLCDIYNFSICFLADMNNIAPNVGLLFPSLGDSQLQLSETRGHDASVC